MGWPKGVPRKRDEVVTGLDGATPAAPMVLSGVVKTSKGFAVATAKFSGTGELERVDVGRSQVDIRFVAQEHQRSLLSMALAALTGARK